MENTEFTLTEKSLEVFNCIRANGRMSIEDLAEKVGRAPRSVNANVTDLCSTKKGLCVREKVETEDGKSITYVTLTEKGQDYTPAN